MKKVMLVVLLLLAALPALGQSQKISELPDGSPAQATDMIPIARAGANYYLPFNAFLTAPDSVWMLKDEVDPTKTVQFQLSPFATGTARTYFFPLQTGSTNKYFLTSGSPITLPAASSRTDLFSIGSGSQIELKQTHTNTAYSRLVLAYTTASLTAVSSTGAQQSYMSVTSGGATTSTSYVTGTWPYDSSISVSRSFTYNGDSYNIDRYQSDGYGGHFSQSLYGMGVAFRQVESTAYSKVLFFNGGLFKSYNWAPLLITRSDPPISQNRVFQHSLVTRWAEGGGMMMDHLGQYSGAMNGYPYGNGLYGTLQITLDDDNDSITSGYIYVFADNGGLAYSVNVGAGAGTYTVGDLGVVTMIKYDIEGLSGDETVVVEFNDGTEPTSILSPAVAPVEGNVFRIAEDGVNSTPYYTFVTTVANDYDVKIGADLTESYEHLVCAVLDTGCTEGAGNDYMASAANSNVKTLTFVDNFLTVEYIRDTPYLNDSNVAYQASVALELEDTYEGTTIESAKWGDNGGTLGYGGALTAGPTAITNSFVSQFGSVIPQSNVMAFTCGDPLGCEITLSTANGEFIGTRVLVTAWDGNGAFYPVTVKNSYSYQVTMDGQDIVLGNSEWVEFVLNPGDGDHGLKWVESNRHEFDEITGTQLVTLPPSTDSGASFEIEGLEEQRLYLIEGGYTVTQAVAGCQPSMVGFDFTQYPCPSWNYLQVEINTADPGGGSTLSDYKVQVCGVVAGGIPAFRCDIFDGATPPEQLLSGVSEWAVVYSVKIVSQTGGITDETIQVRLRAPGPNYQSPNPVDTTLMVEHSASDLTATPLALTTKNVFRLTCLDTLNCVGVTFANDSSFSNVPIQVIIGDNSAIGNPRALNGQEVLSLDAVGTVQFTETGGTMNLDAPTVTLGPGSAIGFMYHPRNAVKWIQTSKSSN
jgi:hypothetical protein